MIEILIALLILSIGLLAIAQLQVVAIRGLTFARHLSGATQVAEQHMEFLRSVPFDDQSDVQPEDGDGNPIVDDRCPAGTSQCHVLFDHNGSGNGQPSLWHYYADPIRSHGQDYYIRWTVERGGPTGTSGGGPDAPGPFQAKIMLDVIWWENPKDLPDNIDTILINETDTISLRNIRDDYNGHGVHLESMLQSNM